MKGIIVLNKPSGISSAQAVSKARRILGVKKIGHMGTLDPAGCGVLLLGVGKATRLFDYFLNKDKEYQAEFAFGYETDTLDGEGETVQKTSYIPTLTQIKQVSAKFVGKISQVPPNYSAKSINGKRAYDLARSGSEFTLKPCDVNVYSINVLRKTADDTYLFKIHCSSGTYVRSLCRDIAKSANSLATMISIRRTRSGIFSLENSVTLDELELKKSDAIISIEDALIDVAKLTLSKSDFNDLLCGKTVNANFDGLRALTDESGKIVALVESVENKIKIKTFLKDDDK